MNNSALRVSGSIGDVPKYNKNLVDDILNFGTRYTWNDLTTARQNINKKKENIYPCVIRFKNWNPKLIYVIYM